MWGGDWEKQKRKKNKKRVQLGREVGEEREGGRNKVGQVRNVKFYISKNGIATKQGLKVMIIFQV